MKDNYVIPRIQTIQQMRNLCGPAVLASVLNYWGLEISQSDIAARTFHSAARATHGSDLLLFARELGLGAYSYTGNLRDLRQKVSEGIPLIVRQIASPKLSSPHYRMVIGYDDRSANFIVSDPGRPQLEYMPYRTFNQLWKPCARWTLLVVPRDRDEFYAAHGNSNPVFHYDMATAYLHAGDYHSAMRSITHAYELDPMNKAICSLVEIVNRSFI